MTSVLKQLVSLCLARQELPSRAVEAETVAHIVQEVHNHQVVHRHQVAQLQWLSHMPADTRLLTLYV